MKTIIATLSLLLPLVAQAAPTNANCNATSPAGPFQLHLYSLSGAGQEGAHLTLIADGVLHTVLDARVDKVEIRNPFPHQREVVLEITTLDANGLESEDSGKATISLQGAPGEEDSNLLLAHDGSIVLSKLPRVRPPLRLSTEYALSDCEGRL